MNLDPSETKLENLLRGLVPDAPSPALMERIDEELKLDMSWLNATARPQRRVNWITSVGWSAFGAAAAVAVMSFMPAQPHGAFQNAASFAAVTSAPSSTSAMPVSATLREWDVMKSDAPQENSRRPREQPVLVVASSRQAWLSSSSRNGARITVETPPDPEKLALPVNFLSEAPFPLPDLSSYQP